MAINNKKYLDYAGLEKLKDLKAIVPHPTPIAKTEGAYKFALDESGHVYSTSPLTAGDLGLDNALHFVGVSTTDPAASTGATVAGHTGSFVAGDVCIYQRANETGYEEYIYTGAAWELLGDASSYALRDEVNAITVKAGHHLTGGGSLGDGEITLNHDGFGTPASTDNIKSYDVDECGHVRPSKEILVQSSGGGNHNHTTSTTIVKDTYVTEVTDTHTKLSINPTTAKVLTGIEDKLANLNTTSIRGVSGITKVSKATADTAVDVAMAGIAVTGLAKRANKTTTIGNANVGTGTTVASGTVTSVSKPTVTVTPTAETNAYHATVSEETLILTPATLTVTATAEATAPTVTLGTKTIKEAVASENKIWGVDETTASVTPAVANGKITPYTFEEIEVATANTATTTVATGSVSVGGAGAAIMTGTETTDTNVLNGATIVRGTTGDVDVVDEVTVTKNAAATFTGTTSPHTEGTHTHTLYTE